MRVAAIVVLALALGSAASAQTNAARRLFTASDYQTYFSEGDFHIESPTLKSAEAEQARWNGKSMVLTTILVHPNTIRSLPYPYAKDRGVRTRSSGAFDTALKAYVYSLTASDLDDQASAEIWMSHDNNTAISPHDFRLGTATDYDRAVAKSFGVPLEKMAAMRRNTGIGRWTLRCSYISGKSYEVECTQTSPGNAFSIVRRYRKQTGMS